MIFDGCLHLLANVELLRNIFHLTCAATSTETHLQLHKSLDMTMAGKYKSRMFDCVPTLALHLFTKKRMLARTLQDSAPRDKQAGESASHSYLGNIERDRKCDGTKT